MLKDWGGPPVAVLELDAVEAHVVAVVLRVALRCREWQAPQTSPLKAWAVADSAL